jgi:Ca2+-binding RTX toxin-like protein
MQGSDTLIGGGGKDTFAYESRSDFINATTGERFTDIIKDFDVKHDKIDMSKLMSTFVGDRSVNFQTIQTDTGTLLKVHVGRAGWFDAVFLEGVKLGNADKVVANWLNYGGTAAPAAPSDVATTDNIIWGTDGSNKMSAGAGNDKLWDLGGDDTMRGGLGDDTFTVGRGNDILNADGGTDTLDFIDARSGIKVDLTTHKASGDLGDDTVINFETVLGSKFDDMITGSRFADTLTGNEGNDILRGMQGNDVLTGGDGADTFVWGASGDVQSGSTKTFFVDTIRDFNAAEDHIDLSGLLATAKGDKSLLIHLDETDAGTMLQVKLGSAGWHDVVMLEGAKLGDHDSVVADWLIV